MKSSPRYFARQVLEDLERKMLFVAGPRQVGRGLRYLKARFPDAAARQFALHGERDQCDA